MSTFYAELKEPSGNLNRYPHLENTLRDKKKGTGLNPLPIPFFTSQAASLLLT